MTWIPYPGHWPERNEAASLATALQVPFISPVVDGLVTRDDEHLDDESAERFSAQFLKDFEVWLKREGTTTISSY